MSLKRVLPRFHGQLGQESKGLIFKPSLEERVVEPLDATENIGPGFCRRQSAPPIGPLTFELAEEAFRRCVVVAVPHIAHAADDAVIFQDLLVLGSGARRWLGSRGAMMRWLADSTWVYIVHLPLLLAIQYRLLDRQLHWIVKFVYSLIVTLLVSFASYQVPVRQTVIGRLLNGKLRVSTTPAGIGGTDTV